MDNQEKLFLERKDGRMLVKYVGDFTGRIAYRIFREGILVHKVGYRSETEWVFNSLTAPGVWWGQAYLRKNGVVRKIRSNKIEISLAEKTISPSNIDPRYYEIRNFSNLEKEIEDLINSGFVAMGRQDLNAWKLSLPIDWLQDPYNDRNWMFQLHAWRMLDPFLRRFNQSDVDYISGIINDWVDYELSGDYRNSRWLWYDMSTGLRALKISYFLRRCAYEEMRHSIVKVEYLIEQHLKHLTNRRELSSGNHGIFQLNGLMSLVWFLEEKIGWSDGEQLAFAKRYAIAEMVALLSRQLGQHGVHTEDSPDYHFFAINKISNVLSAPWWKGAELKKIETLIQKAEDAKHWFVTPAGECVPVGDSTRSIKIKNNSGVYRWPHKRNGKEIAARIDGYSVVRSKPESTIDNSSFLFFQGSFYSGAHKHADDLSFVWQESGRYFLIDSGKYGYQSDRFRSYFQSSLAHNTITVDGKSSSRSNRDAYGSALEGNPIFYGGYWILSGAVQNKSLEYRHRRVILYKPKVSLVVVDYIYNNKSSTRNRKLQFAWHFDPRFKLSQVSDEVCVNDISSGDRVRMKISSMQGQIGFQCWRGRDQNKELFGWVSNDYLKYEPSPSVLVDASLKSSNIVLTEFYLDQSTTQNELFLNETGLWSSDEILLKYVSDPTYDVSFVDSVAEHYNFLPYSKFKGMSHFFKLSEGSRSLFVSFHGSIKPSTPTEEGTKLPVFRLHDLNISHQPHVLCFSDLLLDFYKDKGVYLSWFLDTNKLKQRDLIAEVIRYYVERYDIEHVLLHGSSGGGHVAVEIAVRMGYVALVSNCQFNLDDHSQFGVLRKALEENGDELLPFDLKSLLKGGSGAKVISYCNEDDYTFSHHKYLEETLCDLLPGGLTAFYFGGADIAKKRGVKNHNVGYPNGDHVRNILSKYFKDCH